MQNSHKLRNILIGILLGCVLLGLCISGVSRVREAAVRADSSNKLKQIALSLQNYESAIGRFPPLFGGGSYTNSATENFTIAGGSVGQASVLGPIHLFIIPWMGKDTLYRSMTVTKGEHFFTDPYAGHEEGPGYKQERKWLYSPSDPSHVSGKDSQGRGVTSYAANAQLFAKTNRQGLVEGELTGTSGQYDRGLAITEIKDGSENTIAFAEKYGSCGHGGSLWSGNINGSGPPIQAAPAGTKHDPYYWPVFALGGASGPATRYALDPKQGESAVLFQSQPKFAPGGDCDPFRAAAFSSAEILAGMADGSVRNFTKSVTPAVWFLALYPEDGEKVELD